MPVMVRPFDRARKIAFKILGKPANMQARTSIKDRRINKRLIFEETARVR